MLAFLRRDMFSQVFISSPRSYYLYRSSTYSAIVQENPLTQAQHQAHLPYLIYRPEQEYHTQTRACYKYYFTSSFRHQRTSAALAEEHAEGAVEVE